MDKGYLHPMFNIDALEIINKFEKLYGSDYFDRGFAEAYGYGTQRRHRIPGQSAEQKRAAMVMWLARRVGEDSISRFRREILIPMYPHLSEFLFFGGGVINGTQFSVLIEHLMSDDAKTMMASQTGANSDMFSEVLRRGWISLTPFTPQMNFMNWIDENPLEVK